MSSSQDSTLEEDVINDDEPSTNGQGQVGISSPVQQTTTDFSRISFLVDEETSDDAAFVESDEITDSFDPNDHTDEHTQIDEDPFEESCNTLEVDDE
ncbi:MAG: hypothetical protein ACPGQS_03215 [Bradymonadia bacterium]